MDKHDQSANADVVSTVGESKQEDGSDVVYDLFFEILEQKTELVEFKILKMSCFKCIFETLRYITEYLFQTSHSIF